MEKYNDPVNGETVLTNHSQRLSFSARLIQSNEGKMCVTSMLIISWILSFESSYNNKFHEKLDLKSNVATFMCK